jgi:L1 cell adhesion molecule like protein
MMGFKNVVGQPESALSTLSKASALGAPFNLSSLVVENGDFMFKLQDGTLVKADEAFVEFMSLLKKTVENYNTDEITGAVMCCPVGASEDQMQKWGELLETQVGLPVVRWVLEPMAALLAYGLCDIPNSHHARTGLESTALVIDAGASALKVSVFGLHNRVATLLAHTSDDNLGGKALDRALFDHFLAEATRELGLGSSDDLSKKSKAKLWMQCEVTKRTLSNTASAPCFVESLHEGRDFNSTLQRMRFEMLGMRFFRKCSEVIRQACTDAGVRVGSIQNVRDPFSIV